MKQTLATLFLFFSIVFAFAQLPFKYDSLYKRIYAKDICNILKKHPDLLFIDVRTPGEYFDTSRFASLNQGHLKGAINLDIEKIKKDSSLVDQYKDKTIVLYCSHSQRSRRVSKLLSEKGFTNFYNLNGGMSSLNQLTETEFPCKKDWIISSLPYKNLSYTETAKLIQKEKELVIIDIRTDAQFNSKDTTRSSNVGRLKGAINVPYEELNKHIKELMRYKQKPVLIYGASGDGNSARAATTLKENGFAVVYQLLGGINEFVSDQENNMYIENPAPYRVLDATHTLKFLKETELLTVYDTRSTDEYNNRLTGTIAYRNLGRMKNAIHAEEAGFQTQVLPDDKNAPILIYGNEAAFRFADLLATKGYKKVHVLDSFYGFVWSGFNIESCKEAKTFLENHEGLY